MTSLDAYLASMDVVAPPADGVDTGGVPTRTSSSAVAITAGSAWITVDGTRKWCKIPAGSISSIPAASSGNVRYDLIVASLPGGAPHGSAPTVSRVAGTQSTGTPAIPSVPAAAVPLALLRVTSTGIVDEPALIDQRWRAQQRSRTVTEAGAPFGPLRAGQTTNALPGAVDGDEIKCSDTGDVWRYDGAAWRFHGSIALAEGAAGADATTSNGDAPIGVLTASVAGMFSIASSTRLVVAKSGLYEIDGKIRSATDSPDVALLTIYQAAGGERVEEETFGRDLGLGTMLDTFRVQGTVRLAAGDAIAFTGQRASGSSNPWNLASVVVRRVAP